MAGSMQIKVIPVNANNKMNCPDRLNRNATFNGEFLIEFFV